MDASNDRLRGAFDLLDVVRVAVLMTDSLGFDVAPPTHHAKSL
jgi:hypothetical protein